MDRPPRVIPVLAVWFCFGLLGAGLALRWPAIGLAVGAIGGVVFGWLAAKRVDARHVRRRRPQSQPQL